MCVGGGGGGGWERFEKKRYLFSLSKIAIIQKKIFFLHKKFISVSE